MPIGRTGRLVDWCRDKRECVCASACALIWFGAVERDGVVGLHRPFTEDPAFKALTPAEASNVYRNIINRVTRYLDDMEVPKTMIDAMVSTGSSEIRWIDEETDGLRRPPSIAEWEDASCGSFTDEELRAFYDLLMKTSRRATLSSQEKLLFNVLDDKFQKDDQCRSYLLSSQRTRIAPP